MQCTKTGDQVFTVLLYRYRTTHDTPPACHKASLLPSHNLYMYMYMYTKQQSASDIRKISESLQQLRAEVEELKDDLIN